MKNINDFLNEGMGYERHDVNELAEYDGEWMGSAYEYYITKKKCTLDEWVEAGLQWCEDAHDNGDIDDEQYETAIDHYNMFIEEFDR